MSAPEKHTIYIDVDDEITAIIDKVKSAPSKIVALVLPKRATVLQSIVNMRLLKKSAIAAKKNIVLITSEAGLMPLAGVVGLHVAASLQSKPSVPNAPSDDEPEAEEIAEAADEEETELDKSQTVGALSGQVESDDNDPIELDNEDETPVVDGAKQGKKKSKKSFKVPNFDRFRVGVFLAAFLIVGLAVGWVVAFNVMPKANVLITTDSTTLESKLDITASTTLQDVNLANLQVPASLKEVKKTDTEKATATAKVDKGTKAAGTMTLTNCINDGVSHTIPSGTGFSSGSYTFITNEAVTLDPALYSGQSCKSSSFGLNKDVAVTASKGGADYNLTARSYASSITGVNAYGSAMAGGTTNLVTALGQDDVDAAVAKMKGRLDEAAKKDLQAQLRNEGLSSIDETLLISAPAVTSIPAVGTETTGEVTVTAITTYNIVGVKKDYLRLLVKKDVSSKIDSTKQSILDDGVEAAIIKLSNRKSPTEILFNIQSIVIAGPQLNADSIKNEIKGKKRGDAEKIINSKTGVKDVTITYKPFWVFSTPNSVNKITVTIQKPVFTKSSSTSNNP